mmetsp:Transcript_28016/g.45480  ORF Transcript_28016/g.45480 Transcript_28016/m.45480 type:complete len:359 (+) Transcript_28016:157-1233(+)|eukprot:CAMPEP_0184656990 /NCGR_PEP_ID=MMETSP0308-20130426/16888_1 /TAXON_ID=38269 /ORGANISM="Gloeochaete witrockiana, Strain SAG 46.84" /LENGTH=358 /DNA_ID=CAMNT_0027094335 /DNA_START=116 /DNA_END=1192 /DNA_ORIENTATION=-
MTASTKIELSAGAERTIPLNKAVEEAPETEEQVVEVEKPHVKLHSDASYHPQVIAAAVAFYFITSLSVVFLNKYVLSYSSVSFPRPLFLTWFQLVVALVMISAAGEIGRRIPSLSFMPPVEFKWECARATFPLAVVFVLMLATSNLCLQYVEVSFYQVVKSLNIICNIALGYLILGHSVSGSALSSCAVVMLGYFMAAYGEVRFSWPGIVFGLVSSIFVSLNSIYVKKVLPAVDNDTWRLAIYNTILSIFILFPVVLAWGDFSALMESAVLKNSSFWAISTLSGVLGYFINIATFLQIKFTSPLTHTISGTAKAIVQTVLGALLFQNPISLLNGLGNAICIGGTFLYAFVRHREMQAK